MEVDSLEPYLVLVFGTSSTYLMYEEQDWPWRFGTCLIDISEFNW